MKHRRRLAHVLNILWSIHFMMRVENYFKNLEILSFDMIYRHQGRYECDTELLLYACLIL
jgi:hypothetical protein